MSKMGSHHSFQHLKHKLWPKEKPGVKLTIWLPITKSQESTLFPCMQAACDTLLESSWWGLRLCLRPHCNSRSACKVMGPQNRRSPTVEFPLGSLRTKNDSDVAPMDRCRVYYKGEGGGFPQVRAVVTLVSSRCLWLVLTPKVLQLCINHLCVGFV